MLIAHLAHSNFYIPSSILVVTESSSRDTLALGVCGRDVEGEEEGDTEAEANGDAGGDADGEICGNKTEDTPATATAPPPPPPFPAVSVSSDAATAGLSKSED